MKKMSQGEMMVWAAAFTSSEAGAYEDLIGYACSTVLAMRPNFDEIMDSLDKEGAAEMIHGMAAQMLGEDEVDFDGKIFGDILGLNDGLDEITPLSKLCDIGFKDGGSDER